MFYVECGNATEAYRRAFESRRASAKTINEKASRLFAMDKIQARLEELRAPVREKAQLTLEIHLAELASLRDAARAKKNYAAAISAEVARGKASGFYVERAMLTDLSGPREVVVTYRHE